MSKMDFQQLCYMTLLHFWTHGLLYSGFYYCFSEAKSLMLCKAITQIREEDSVSGWSYKASGCGHGSHAVFHLHSLLFSLRH